MFIRQYDELSKASSARYGYFPIDACYSQSCQDGGVSVSVYQCVSVSVCQCVSVSVCQSAVSLGCRPACQREVSLTLQSLVAVSGWR